MGKVIIGSHDTMTYLPPKWWILRPINWLFAKCQDNLLGWDKIRCVDLRIYYNEKKGKWSFAHGLIAYSDRIHLRVFLNFLLNRRIKYIRIILERDGYEDAFITLCNNLIQEYPTITFLGGYRKSDWKQLYKFEAEDIYSGKYIPIHQWVGSMAPDAKWYEKFIPRLYAKRMNEFNMKNNLKEGINLFDFI